MKRLLRTHRKKIAYLAVGGWNTAFGYGSFAALYFVCQRLGWHYLVALTVSQALSILNGYIGYKRLVFRTTGGWLAELGRFSLVYWGLFAANAAILPAMVHAGMSPLAAQAVFTVLTVAGTYFAHGRFSFRPAPAAV